MFPTLSPTIEAGLAQINEFTEIRALAKLELDQYRASGAAVESDITLASANGTKWIEFDI